MLLRDSPEKASASLARLVLAKLPHPCNLATTNSHWLCAQSVEAADAWASGTESQHLRKAKNQRGAGQKRGLRGSDRLR
jgi:hypothetical protein